MTQILLFDPERLMIIISACLLGVDATRAMLETLLRF